MFDIKNQVHQHIDTKKEDEEFDLWSSHQAIDNQNSSHNVVTYDEQYYFHDYSSPLCKTKFASKNVESSPLLSRNYHTYSQVSPQTCSRAIAEGRKELMDIISNMPESSYELSLTDLVDEEQVKEKEVVSNQEASFRFYSYNDQSKTPTRNKRKSVHKSVQMSRRSTEKEAFLIKMFIPSLSWKTKVKPEKPSRLCSSFSFDGSENHVHEEWSLKRLLALGKGKGRSSSSKSTCSSLTDSPSRHSKPPGCWSLICIHKSKRNECNISHKINVVK